MRFPIGTVPVLVTLAVRTMNPPTGMIVASGVTVRVTLGAATTVASTRFDGVGATRSAAMNPWLDIVVPVGVPPLTVAVKLRVPASPGAIAGIIHVSWPPEKVTPADAEPVT